jgi:rhodanese-related sulfurtransferase
MRRSTNALRLLLTLGCAALQPACSTCATSHISQDDLLAKIQSATAPPIIDVRTQGEYDSGHVPGAIHIPFYAVFWHGAEIPASPDQPVVVYCAHGPRAGVAKLELRAAGFAHVLYLEGHMSAWKQRGLPIETGGE